MDLGAVIVEFLQDGIGNGTAHAAADHADLLLTLGLGGLAQGAHEVLQAVALVQALQLLSGGTHGLDDDGDCALFGVVVIDGDGNTFTHLIHTQDDELTRLSLLGDQRRLDLIQSHSRPEFLFSHDTKHTLPSFPNPRILICDVVFSKRHIVAILIYKSMAVNKFPPNSLSFFRQYCKNINNLAYILFSFTSST